jgi:hypothetical protein
MKYLRKVSYRTDTVNNTMIKTTGIDSDWAYEYTDNRFVLHIQPASQRLSFREACVFRAKELSNALSNPVLSISGGLDSQIVLHSFYEQGLKLNGIFRHFPGHNDRELANINLLKKKYGFDLRVIEIYPEEHKEEIIAEYQKTKIPYNQLLYKKFYSMVDEKLDILQGLDGPNIYMSKNDGDLYLFESYNSFEFSRRRAVDMLNRTGRFVSFEKNSNVLLSILCEETMETFCNTYDYFINNQVQGVKIIDLWDVYVKTYIYYKYWKKELSYFPKYQGHEGIDWIMNGPINEYAIDMIPINLKKLKQFLISGTSTQKFVAMS